jgi:hypothetical protein
MSNSESFQAMTDHELLGKRSEGCVLTNLPGGLGVIAGLESRAPPKERNLGAPSL